MTHNGSMAGHEDAMAERRLVRAGVTEREAEVLSVVAERLRNREIASRLHISVRTVESHVAALLRKLGAADRTALAEMGAELRRAPRAGTVLPVPLTSLVGREGETSELIALLDAHRLVTLTGPAGVGKTRLALRIATVRAGSFPDGVRLADLAPVTPELAGGTLALALGVVPQPGWPLRDILREVAGGMHCLLLVDNCEHVITEAAESVAPAVAALCQRLDGLPLAIELAASRMRSFAPAELVEHVGQRFELLSAGTRTAPPRHRTLRGAIDWSYELLDDDERVLFSRLGVFPADFDYAAVQSVCGNPGGAVVRLLPRLVDKSLVSTAGHGRRRYRLLETIRAYAAERLAASGAETTIRRQHADHYLALTEHAAGQLCTSRQRARLDRLMIEQPNLRAALAHSITAGDVESAWRWVALLERFWDITGQRREAREWIQRALAIGDPPATPAAVAGLAAASAILQPADARAAFGLAQQAAQLAADLDDLTRARAALSVGMSGIWVQPELVAPALREALARFGADHPWECALTMQCLANTSGGLAEALDWAREGAALFRRVGDHLYAANTLFIMAQRAMYAGIAGDEVHEWLTESQALAEAAGSEGDRVHAMVGFGQLAWVRGDHGHAAQLMEECLPALRRLGDQRCAGRALHMLGERAREQRQLARAGELLGGSVAAIALAGQSVVLVNALEALAAVLFAQGRLRRAAVLLGTAHAARESASAHMQPTEPPDEELRRSLTRELGAAAFDAAYGEGMRLSPTQALQVASPGRTAMIPTALAIGQRVREAPGE